MRKLIKIINRISVIFLRSKTINHNGVKIVFLKMEFKKNMLTQITYLITLSMFISINILSWLQKENRNHWIILEKVLSITIKILRNLSMKMNFGKNWNNVKIKIRNINYLCFMMRNMFQNGLGILNKLPKLVRNRKKIISIKIHLVF